jgi:hypothetical protein
VANYKTEHNVLLEKVYTSPEIIGLAIESTSLSSKQIEFMFRYNVFTVAQMGILTGMGYDFINAKIKSGHLTRCYPFPNFSEKRQAFVFVLRDDNSMMLIKRFIS